MTDIYRIWMKRTKGFFEPEELLSPDGMELFSRGHMVMNWDFLDKLVAFREKMAVPFTVNSGFNRRRGWRSSAENLTYPCEGNPYHPMGVAADISTKLNGALFAGEAEAFGFVGIGLYDTFVHIDLRPKIGDNKFMWDNRRDR